MTTDVQVRGAPKDSRPGAAVTTSSRHERRRAQRRESTFGYAMIALSLLIVIVFTAAPILASFVLSLFSWDVISPPSFVGLENFRSLIGDRTVLHSFQVTIVLAVAIVLLQLVLGLSLAVLVQQRRRKVTRTFFRTAYYLPLLASGASVSIFMGYLFDEKFGVVNYYLGELGAPAVPWLTSNLGAMVTIVLVAVWQQLGFTFILFVAALSSLPKDILEAAQIDGAGPVRGLFGVKIPLISPTVFFAAVVGLINAMQLFDQPYIMTHGGPGDATKTTVIVIYETTFQNIEFGYGSAISVVLFLLLLLITGLQFLVARRWVFYT
jgi:multiple sugar transport system permease protein